GYSLVTQGEPCVLSRVSSRVPFVIQPRSVHVTSSLSRGHLLALSRARLPSIGPSSSVAQSPSTILIVLVPSLYDHRAHLISPILFAQSCLHCRHQNCAPLSQSVIV
ncbi:hypothetical protein GBA52_024700, partial [Prunus armeniaca]